MAEGVITRLNADKGFGFIKGDGMAKDLFFHRSAADNFAALQEGQRVTFEADMNAPKGPRAENVSPTP